jgi:phospholipase D1/2
MVLQDPLSPEFENLWKGTAERNTEAFANVFRCVPAAGIQTWKQYKGESL